MKKCVCFALITGPDGANPGAATGTGLPAPAQQGHGGVHRQPPLQGHGRLPPPPFVSGRAADVQMSFSQKKKFIANVKMSCMILLFSC